MSFQLIWDCFQCRWASVLLYRSFATFLCQAQQNSSILNILPFFPKTGLSELIPLELIVILFPWQYRKVRAYVFQNSVWLEPHSPALSAPDFGSNGFDASTRDRVVNSIPFGRFRSFVFLSFTTRAGCRGVHSVNSLRKKKYPTATSTKAHVRGVVMLPSGCTCP